MDKSVQDIQINKKPLISQPSSSNNQSNYKIPQIPVSKKAKHNEESNKNNIDYKNISLTITGKLLSQPSKFYIYILISAINFTKF